MAAFTMLMTERDWISPVHYRAIVILRPEQCADGLYLRQREAELLQRCLPDRR